MRELLISVTRQELEPIDAAGRPTAGGYTAGDVDTGVNVMARSTRAAGGGPGHIVHVPCGYGLSTGGLGANYGAEGLVCTVVPVSWGRRAGGRALRGTGQHRPGQPDLAPLLSPYRTATSTVTVKGLGRPATREARASALMCRAFGPIATRSVRSAWRRRTS